MGTRVGAVIPPEERLRGEDAVHEIRDGPSPGNTLLEEVEGVVLATDRVLGGVKALGH